jgi:hypothetical protein
MNNMKNTASTSKLSNFLAELNLVLAGSHNLPLDDDCTGGIAILGEDEKLVGTVPEGLTRVLYLVSRYYDLLAAEHHLAYQFTADGSKAETVAQSMSILCKERADTYRAMFWCSVHDTYPPGKGYQGLTLRQGWAITETPEEDATTIVSLLNLLKGGRR